MSRSEYSLEFSIGSQVDMLLEGKLVKHFRGGFISGGVY